MRTILKDNAKHYIAVFLIMFIAFAFPVIANADSGKLRLTITDTSYNETHYYLDKGQTYPGVSYDAATNTITLTNANLGDAFLYYNGETDLTITLVGNSYMEHVGYYGSGIVMSDETAQAALTINGSGSLTMTNYIYEGIAQRDDSSEDNPVDGDIVIDGARLNFEKSSGIMSNYSDVIIKNGAYVYIDGNNDRGSYGIITGRNGEAFDTTGKLAISNSDVIMKNCTSTLAYNRLEAEGVYFYGGEADAEYVLDIKINPPFRWSLTEYGYLGATTTEKEIRTEYVNNVFVTDNAMDYTGKIVKPGIVAYNAAGDELETADIRMSLFHGRLLMVQTDIWCITKKLPLLIGQGRLM